MANDTNTPTEVSAADTLKTFTMKDFADAVAAGVAEGVSKAQRRKITYGQYPCISAQQPDKFKTVRLERGCFQNGGRMDPTRLTNDEIKLLNQIHRSGRYIDRFVEVIIGRDGSDDAVDFRYNCKSNDQRNVQKDHFRSLLEMLQKIVAEQTERDEADEEVATRPSFDTSKRTFGQSRATREAQARANA